MNRTAVTLSTIVFVISFPLCVCLYIILRLFSYIFYFLAKIKYGSKAFRPSTMDVLAGMSSDLSPPYYNVIFSLEGQAADINTIRRHYTEKLFNSEDKQQVEASKKWRSNLMTFCGYYIWLINDRFDVKNHIKMVKAEDVVREHSIEYVDETENPRIPFSKDRKPLNNMSWEEIVHCFVTTYGVRDLHDMPKWELLVLEENENRYTCLFRVHHSICDGMHFGRMMTKVICDQEIQSMTAPVRPRSITPFWSRVSLAVRSFCLLPYGIWAGAVYKDQNPLHGKELSGNKTYYISKPIPLSKVMDIKTHLKVTVNDIVVSCVSKAVTSHFEHILADVPEVTTLLPMSRALNDDDVKMRNDVAITAVKLPTYPMVNKKHEEGHCRILANFCQLKDNRITELNSLQRLAIVQNNLKEAKSNPTTMAICWFLMTVSSHLPAWLANAIIVMDGLTLNISNVRGPQGDNWTIGKAALTDFAFLLNDKDPLGLAVSVLSFRNAIRFGLIIDDALMTKAEGQSFIDNLITEVNNLQNETNVLNQLLKK